MNKSYLNSVNNTAFSLKPSRAIHLLLMVLFVGLFGNIETAKAAVRTASVTGNWNNTATWGGSSVPTISDDVVIPNGKTVTVTADAFVKSIVVNNGGTLNVNSPAVLTVGTIGTSATTQVVDFQNGSYVNVYTGASMIVYGLLNNSNNSDNVKFDGTVSVDGNITVGNGSTITGSGSLSSSGTVTGAGTVFGSTNDCNSGNGCNYGCSVNTISANQTICSGSTATLTGNSGTGYSYQWQSSTTSSSSGFSNISGATSSSYTSSSLTTTTYYRRIVSVLGCSSSNSNVIKININAFPNTPAVSITQPTCTLSTGTITVAVQGIGETYSFDNGSNFQSGNSKSGLAAGSYDIIIKSSGGCISPTTSITIKSATNVWNGSVWSNGSVPISTENIEFAGNYSSSSDLSGCSCKVTAGAVVINSPHTLAITNAVSVLGGSLTFKHDLNVPSNSASLVQKNNVTNSGNIIYERMTNTLVRNTDYTYWSSPVSSQTLYNLSPFTLSGMLHSYEVTATSEDWKQEIGATTMAVGKGYAVRGPENKGLNLFLASFNGVPNNGSYALTGIFADKSYLLGNPYPSAINADTFLSENAGVLDGTLYFWTHNTKQDVGVSNPGSGTLAYSSDDYASYNVTGGVGVGTGNFASADEQTYNKPTGKIAAGQGFFASTKVAITGTNEIVFNNDMRVAGTSGNNSQFFKTKNSNGKTAKAIEKNRVWLNLANAEGAFKQTLVGYITDATNEYDGRFDGESFDGNDFVDFYSINQDKNLVIQGRALPFDENDEVPLGYRTTIDGTFTINIDQVDGTLTNQAMFLEDKLTNTIFDLKSGNYTFNTVAGTFDDRFVLRYVDKVNTDKTLGLNETDVNDGIIVLYSNNYKTLIIKNNVQDATVNSVTLYNMLGQKITDWDVKDREQTSIQIPIKNVSPEMYIVKVKTTKGEASKKIVVR